MPEQKYPPELEMDVREALDVPEPNADALTSLREQFIARGAAALKSDRQPDSVSNPFRPEKDSKMKQKTSRFSPRPAAQIERKSFMLTLRARPALAILLAMLILLMLSGAAYAIGRSLGYIPGVGLVENPNGMRVLEEPISQTRDGVTLTIKQLLVYLDHIQMVYDVSGIAPGDNTFFAEDGNTAPKAFCGGVEIGDYPNTEGDPVIHLPDGAIIERMEGQDSRYPENVYGNMPVFITSLPADITELTVTFKCIYGARLGAVPENWEFSVKLKSVPAGTVIGEPVLEVTPSASSSASDSGIIVTLDRVVPQDGKYLFYLSAVADDKQNPISDTFAGMAYLVDATGQKVTLTDMRPPSISETDPSWELQPLSPLAYGPYTLVVKQILATYQSDNVSFEFDPGPNPQVGQTWQLDQTINLGGGDLKVVSAKMVEKDLTSWNMPAKTQGIEFTFQSMDGKTLIQQLNIMDNLNGLSTPDSDYWSEPTTSISIRLFYEKGIPVDKVRVQVYSESIVINGDWELQWAAPKQTGVNLLDAANAIASTPNAAGVTAELQRVVKLDDGYLFFVKMNTPEQTPEFRVLEPVHAYVIDSSGKKIELQLDAPQPFYARKDNLWQFSAQENIAAGALKLVVETAKAHYTNFNFDYFSAPLTQEEHEKIIAENSFTFDVGADPQVDQTWTLNQEFELGGYKGKVVSVRAVEVDSKQLPFPNLQSDASINRGYEFVIEALDPSVQWNVGIFIDKLDSDSPSSGLDCIGYMDGDYESITKHTITCRGLSGGVLRATVESISVLLNDVWEVNWTLPAQ